MILKKTEEKTRWPANSAKVVKMLNANVPFAHEMWKLFLKKPFCNRYYTHIRNRVNFLNPLFIVLQSWAQQKKKTISAEYELDFLYIFRNFFNSAIPLGNNELPFVNLFRICFNICWFGYNKYIIIGNSSLPT